MFGKDFMTHYVPVRDAAGKVVGAFFVGLEFTEGLKALKQSILAIKVGETGYVAALDAGKQKGVATIHPAKEGANLLAAKDSRGFEFVREMVDKKSGSIRYEWANPAKRSAREKVAVFDHYPGWDWVVVSTSYVEEIRSSADTAVRDIAGMALADHPGCPAQWLRGHPALGHAAPARNRPGGRPDCRRRPERAG
jgi:methyl-accepting chemotaxis protein